MNDIRLALMGFWSQFLDRSGVPPRNTPISAFSEDNVMQMRGSPPTPQPPQTFPYIVYPVEMTEMFQGSIITVSVFDRQPAMPGFTGRTDDIVQQIREKIPQGGGVLLQWDKGVIRLQRSNPFSFYMSDPNDRVVVRAIVRLIIANYTQS